jgi:hypothetical protein
MAEARWRGECAFMWPGPELLTLKAILATVVKDLAPWGRTRSSERSSEGRRASSAKPRLSRPADPVRLTVTRGCLLGGIAFHGDLA